MTDFAALSLTINATGMAEGERALDSLAKTGARVEGTLKLNTRGIEQAMAALGNTMAGLGGTMKALETAVAKSMGNTAAQTERSARTFDDLRRSLDPAYAASQRYAEVQRELAAMVAAGETSQRAANIVLEQAASRYMGVATAAERAEQAQREQAAAVASATTNYQQLRASLDPVYASSKRYEAALETAASQILVGKNATRAAYNRRIRRMIGRTGDMPEVEDRLVCLKNDRSAGIFNGGIFKVTALLPKKSDALHVAFEVASEDFPNRPPFEVKARRECFSGGLDDVDWRDLRGTQQFDCGYALTCHKAQGSQWEDVIVYDESGTFRDDWRRWLYTAITRASERITVVV